MLLRSVTKHVNEQNWFAVVLDLVIVVFGVFIGIEVANWNAELEGEKRAQVLVKRLHVDLSNELDAIATLIDYQAVVKKYAVTAIDGLNGDETVSDEQLVIAAYQASQISEGWTYRSTFEELVSTGRFELIKNDELKRLIFGYFGDDWTDQVVFETIAPYREYIRGIIPFQIQDAIRTDCGDVSFLVADTFANALPESCDLQLPDEVFTETADYLRSQPDALVKLRFQIAVYEPQVATLVSFDGEARKLMTFIEEYQRPADAENSSLLER